VYRRLVDFQSNKDFLQDAMVLPNLLSTLIIIEVPLSFLQFAQVLRFGLDRVVRHATDFV